MKIDICQKGESTEVEVPDGVVSVGGDSGDALKIDGVPPHVLDLRIENGRVTVCPRETISVAQVLVPPNVPRLLLPGECVTLAEDVELRVMAPAKAPPPGTVAVLKQLLSGKSQPDATRAATLTCLTGLDMGKHFYLSGSKGIVGRGKEATVRLRDRAVSRSHARIRKGKGGYYLEDLGSPNGVYVNGSRLRTIRILNEGDIVEMGRSLLRYSGPAPEPEAEIAAAPAPKKRSRITQKIEEAIKGDWALIGMGAALALAGLIVGWGFAG